MSAYPGLTPIKHSVLIVNVLADTFNQEKALVGAFSVFVKLRGGSFPALAVWPALRRSGAAESIHLSGPHRLVSGAPGPLSSY